MKEEQEVRALWQWEVGSPPGRVELLFSEGQELEGTGLTPSDERVERRPVREGVRER